MFLNVWADIGSELGLADVDWTTVEERMAQGERLATLIAVCTAAEAIPRRLGAEATGTELAGDKRHARKLVHRLSGALQWWDEGSALESRWVSFLEEEERHALKPLVLDPYLEDEELRARGAQLIWEDWLAEYSEQLYGELIRVAACAVKVGKRRAGNKMCSRLQSEAGQVHRVLNDALPIKLVRE